MKRSGIDIGQKSRDRGSTFATPRAELARTEGPKRKRGIRQRQPRRDWEQAREKVSREGACRFCGRELPPSQLHAAHVIDRSRDEFFPLCFGLEHGSKQDQPWLVHPDRIVPACKPCHDSYDEHEGTVLLGKLTIAEELQAVADSHTQGTRESGIENARRRTAPTVYREGTR